MKKRELLVQSTNSFGLDASEPANNKYGAINSNNYNFQHVEERNKHQHQNWQPEEFQKHQKQLQQHEHQQQQKNDKEKEVSEPRQRIGLKINVNTTQNNTGASANASVAQKISNPSNSENMASAIRSATRNNAIKQEGGDGMKHKVAHSVINSNNSSESGDSETSSRHQSSISGTGETGSSIPRKRGAVVPNIEEKRRPKVYPFKKMTKEEFVATLEELRMTSDPKHYFRNQNIVWMPCISIIKTEYLFPYLAGKLMYREESIKNKSSANSVSAPPTPVSQLPSSPCNSPIGSSTFLPNKEWSNAIPSCTTLIVPEEEGSNGKKSSHDGSVYDKVPSRVEEPHETPFFPDTYITAKKYMTDKEYHDNKQLQCYEKLRNTVFSYLEELYPEVTKQEKKTVFSIVSSMGISTDGYSYVFAANPVTGLPWGNLAKVILERKAQKLSLEQPFILPKYSYIQLNTAQISMAKSEDFFNKALFTTPLAETERLVNELLSVGSDKQRSALITILARHGANVGMSPYTVFHNCLEKCINHHILGKMKQTLLLRGLVLYTNYIHQLYTHKTDIVEETKGFMKPADINSKINFMRMVYVKLEYAKQCPKQLAAQTAPSTGTPASSSSRSLQIPSTGYSGLSAPVSAMNNVASNGMATMNGVAASTAVNSGVNGPMSINPQMNGMVVNSVGQPIAGAATVLSNGGIGIVQGIVGPAGSVSTNALGTGLRDQRYIAGISSVGLGSVSHPMAISGVGLQATAAIATELSAFDNFFVKKPVIPYQRTVRQQLSLSSEKLISHYQMTTKTKLLFVEIFRSALFLRNKKVKEEDIDKLREVYEVVASMWSEEQDFLLLYSLVEFGHSRWQEIAKDPTLSLGHSASCHGMQMNVKLSDISNELKKIMNETNGPSMEGAIISAPDMRMHNTLNDMNKLSLDKMALQTQQMQLAQQRINQNVDRPWLTCELLTKFINDLHTHVMSNMVTLRDKDTINNTAQQTKISTFLKNRVSNIETALQAEFLGKRGEDGNLKLAAQGAMIGNGQHSVTYSIPQGYTHSYDGTGQQNLIQAANFVNPNINPSASIQYQNTLLYAQQLMRSQVQNGQMIPAQFARLPVQMNSIQQTGKDASGQPMVMYAIDNKYAIVPIAAGKMDNKVLLPQNVAASQMIPKPAHHYQAVPQAVYQSVQGQNDMQQVAQQSIEKAKQDMRKIAEVIASIDKDILDMKNMLANNAQNNHANLYQLRIEIREHEKMFWDYQLQVLKDPTKKNDEQIKRLMNILREKKDIYFQAQKSAQQI